MSHHNTDEAQVRAQVVELETDFKSGNYFRVVILAPQLMVQITEVLADYSLAYFRRKGFLDLTADEKIVYELIGRLHRADSDRVKIAAALNSIFDVEHDKDPDARKKFVSAFSKLEALVSMRNRLAHDYFQKPISKRSLKTSASGGMDILRRLLMELEEA